MNEATPSPAPVPPAFDAAGAFQAGVAAAMASSISPMVSAALLKAAGQPVPRSAEGRAEAVGPLFQAAHAASLAVANDPYAALVNAIVPGSGGMVGSPSNQMSWAVLQRAAMTPLISSIQKVLLDQISEFCRPSESDYSPGFKVRLRNRREAGTPASARMCRKFETFISQCGYVEDRRQLLTRPGFTDLTVACMRDSLTYDQLAAETVPTQSLNAADQRPALIRKVDASTIRLSDQMIGAYGLPDTDYTSTRYFQVISGLPVAEFNATQLIFGVRNASTSIYQCGYGISEIQMLMAIITAWLNAFGRNAKYFEQGFGGRGFLVDASDEPLNPQQAEALKTDIQAFMTGTQGSHRLGILQRKMEFMQLGNDVQDQQWSAWSDLQTKLACAIYGVEPASINHIFGNQGQASAMGSVKTAEREDTTRRRGLIPKVRWWFELLDRSLIQQYDPNFELVPTGIETDEAGSLELSTKKLQFSTINEIRASYDLPPRPDGDIIGSTIGVQSAQMLAAKEQAPDEPAESLDAGSLFGGVDEDERSTAEVEDAGQALRDDDGPLQASRRGVAGVSRLRFNL